ncbi:MAG: hypothetical protein JNM45_02675 [Rhizobiales bacterium]|nr:hypothetical protein [Hyphomicrobiales bacterium]
MHKGALGAIACLFALLWSCAVAQADTLSWNTRPFTNLRSGATDSVTLGTAPTQLTIVTSGNAAGSYDATGNALAIEPASTSNGTTGYVNSTMNAAVDNETAVQTTTINFNEPVYNVSVIVGDIDGGPTFIMSGAAFNDIVEFRATSAAGATVMPTSGTPANPSIVTWNAGSGRALSTNQNVTDNSGNVTVTFAGPIRTLTIRHISGANSNVTNPTQQFVYIETVTYTRAPQLRLQKTSNGGVGTFNFSTANVFDGSTWSAQTASSSITTATAGTAVNGSFTRLWNINTNTAIDETGAAGWLITTTPATCTDSNSAASGNPASFTAAVSGYTITLAAANVRAGAVITCAVVNDKRPTIQIVKQSVGGSGSFSFSGTNGVTPTSLNTASSNPASSAVFTLTAASTTTTVTETIPSGWQLASANCTGMGSGGTATLAGNVLTLNAAATAATANIVCTFTNNRIPVVRVQKITTGGAGGPFSFTTANLAGTPSPITTASAGTATPAAPSAINVTTVATAVSISETVSLAWVRGGVTCTDANASVTGNPTPVATGSGGAVVIAAARVVHGADITCVFTNAAAAPQLAVAKAASPASVSAAGQVITYTLTVSNPGNVTLASVTVTDPRGAVTCASSGNNVIASLAPAASETCTLSYAATQADFDSNGGGDGDIDNTATAATTYNSAAVSGSGSAAVALSVAPALTIVKEALPASNVAVGATVTYTYRVRNSGNQTLTNVNVGDVANGYGAAPVPGSEVILADMAPLGDSADAVANGVWDTLRPGDEIRFTATYQVRQQDIDLLQ